jgi:alkylated DNA repair dioxygenase AlkB
VAWLQATLLGSSVDVEVEDLAIGLEHRDLGDGSWVDLRRGFVRGGDELFGRLLESVPWRAEQRRMYDRVVDVPRLVAHYDEGSDLPDPVLGTIRRNLTRRYRNEPGGTLTTVGLCLYRDGHDSVAWHADRLGRDRDDGAIVAIVSLGAPRAFDLRSVKTRQRSRIVFGTGDLLVMGGRAQRTHEHRVPKTRRPVGPRLSVQFRSTGVG